jgi:hypothetical protein
MRRELQTIGPKVLNNYIFLRKIAKSKTEKRRIGLLKNASKEQLLTLVEVASNILSSNFLLTKQQKAKLLPHAHYVRKLSRTRSEFGARKIVAWKRSNFNFIAYSYCCRSCKIFTFKKRNNRR